MYNKTLILVILMLSCINSYSQVQQGCQATNGSNSIYYVRDNADDHGVPQFRNDNFTNRTQISQVYCYSGTASGSGTCYIQGYAGPSSDFGTLVSFSNSPTYCSIEDDIMMFVVLGAIMGFIYIKDSINGTMK